MARQRQQLQLRATRVFLFVALVVTQLLALPALAGENSDFSLSSLPGVREAGVDASLWGWLTYSRASKQEEKSSWGSELELDLTKSFANRVAISTDIEYTDYEDFQRGNIEQLFVSVLLSRDNGTLLTVGKFNSPFGVEGRDFWDRAIGTPSLLFRAQPQDLRGAMLTAPWGESGLTFRPFVVSGFNDEGAIPGSPSAGMMVEYKPNKDWDFAVTNWFGPGLEPRGGEYAEEDEYGKSVFEVTDTWSKPEMASSKAGGLCFLEVKGTWKARPDLTLSAEYLYGANRADFENAFFHGVMLLATYDLDDHWRVFGQWSYLNDNNALVTGVEQRVQEFNVGVGYRLNRHAELRGEFRRDFSSESGDVNSVSINASVGY